MKYGKLKGKVIERCREVEEIESEERELRGDEKNKGVFWEGGVKMI